MKWAIAIMAVAQIYCRTRAYGIFAATRAAVPSSNLRLFLRGDDRRRAERRDAEHLSARDPHFWKRQLVTVCRRAGAA